MTLVPSTDQVKAQLQILIPAVATAATAFGVSATDAGTYSQLAVSLIAPISYAVVAIWVLIDNTRESIMRKASKPVTPDAPAPQIVLPKQEAALADKLPDNVTSK